jgi:hypothetical protein
MPKGASATGRPPGTLAVGTPRGHMLPRQQQLVLVGLSRRRMVREYAVNPAHAASEYLYELDRLDRVAAASRELFPEGLLPLYRPGGKS